MEQIEVEGLRIAYERAGTGNGPPVVLVHGFVGDSRSTWSHQIEALSDEYDVVAMDVPGGGRSSPVPPTFRLPDFADCLVEFIRALGFSRANLVGLSFGSVLALQTFARHPTMAQSLVLVSSYAGWAGSLTPAETEERLAFCLEAADQPPSDFARAMMPSMFSAAASADAVAQFAASVQAFDPPGFKAMARSLAEADLRAVLPTVGVPTLLLHGDEDVRAKLRGAHAMASAIPGSRLVVLPGVGHVSSVEAPELVSREIRDFLRSAT